MGVTSHITESANRIGGGRPFLLGSILVLAAVGVSVLLLHGFVREALTLTLVLVFAAISTVNIRFAILGVMLFLFALGDIRRMLIPGWGHSGADPLLLVGGIFAVIVCGNAFATRTIRLDTPLSKWMLLLMVIMVMQIFNPRQGPLMVGAAGAMFLLVPLMWYWVGKTYATPALMKRLLYGLLIPFALVAAAYGIYHVFYGYLPHQEAWLEYSWHPGLGDPDNPAPVSFFASNTEYGAFLVVATVISWAAFLKGSRGAILFVPVFLSAILLTGSRGPVVYALFGMCIVWAVMGRSVTTWVVRGAVAVILAAFGLAWILIQSPDLGLDEDVQLRLDRQADELVFSDRQPGDYSSTAVHLDMMFGGYVSGVRQPLGYGLGSVTMAADRFGGRGYTTETPWGDSFVALGLPGGVVYHIIMILAVLLAARYWFRARTLVALALLGVTAVTFGYWIGGGQYAVSSIAVFCLGALDKFNREEELKQQREKEELQDVVLELN